MREPALSKNTYLGGAGVPSQWYQLICWTEKRVWPLRWYHLDYSISLVAVLFCGGISAFFGSKKQYGQ
jgi:hypothetical protein